ncbi:helix-turn-helix domain-containing protein [Serratia liquefaciens]|uniref:helix-turn-helix domain-containing protein n=1 Tax=Serratia liquefaciens TaxID=614 RepID=UPI00218361BC|nr:LuxR C-terminal-related transcriptional regulator [Serratia liquefaciens]CAI2413593.1 transcriptional regulator NarP [Serratia liquefaciens]
MLKESITVLLSDKNQFFVDGIRSALKIYFCSKNMNVRFTEDTFEYRTADIIFLAANPSESTLPHYLYSQAKVCCPLVFLIEEDRGSTPITNSASRKKFTYIYRNKSVEALFETIERVIFSRIIQNKINRCNFNNSSRFAKFSTREYEVIHYLSLGLPNISISRKLNLSEKTISQHKRNAMRKLNFKRNAELHFWLLCGGLKDVGRHVVM